MRVGYNRTKQRKAILGVVLVICGSLTEQALAQGASLDTGKSPAAATSPVSTNTAAAAGQPATADQKAPTSEKQALGQLFKQIMEEQNPATPEEHRKVLEDAEKTAKARARKPPKFSTVMRTVPLDPAEKIPVVEMDLDQMSSISFIDMTGQPWPIRSCDWSAGFAGEKPDKGAHFIVLHAINLVDTGSLVCTLDKLTTPVRIQLASGNHIHYLGFDARIPKLGPNAKPPPYDLGGQAIAAGDDILSQFLYGVPPESAEALEVEGGGARTQAWRYKGILYVRTPMILLSPGPKDEAQREGFNVYKLAPVPLLQCDDDGHTVDIKIAGAHVVRPIVPAEYRGDGAPRSKAPPLSLQVGENQ